MPLIKPRTRGKHMVRYTTRLDHETRETLHAYAAFLGESAEYVLNQLIDTMLAKDKEFLSWRAQHPTSYVPHPSPRPARRRTRERPDPGRGTPALGAAVASAASRQQGT